MKRKFILSIVVFVVIFSIFTFICNNTLRFGLVKDSMILNIFLCSLAFVASFLGCEDTIFLKKVLSLYIVTWAILISISLACYQHDATAYAAYYSLAGFILGTIIGLFKNYMSNRKRIFRIGETITITNIDPLPGNDKAPKLTLGETLKIIGITLDSAGNQHLDLGLVSNLNFVRSHETKEHLPDGDKIHWVHPSRVE